MGKMKRGLLLSLEGIDFTWKTPFTQWLKRDFSDVREIIITRDPPYMLSPWDLFRNFFERNEGVSHLSEAVMLLAARIDNNERVIIPALYKGALVIADRYIDSWFAYQAMRLADYFAQNSENAQRFLLELHRIFVDNKFLVQPDLTILISDDPEETIKRRNDGKEISKYDVLEIQQLVHAQYQLLTGMFPERIIPIDVRGKNIDEAYIVIQDYIKKWLEVVQLGD